MADPTAQPQSDGRAVEYELTLEPHGRRWLLALETPESWDAPQAGLSHAYQLVSAAPIDRRISYRGRSSVSDQFADAGSAFLNTYLKTLPAGSNPRAVGLAQSLRAEAGSDSEFLERVLQRFREEEFYYTLTPPSLGEHTVDEFLFETRSGFCGHYASAFTVLARAAGIPARIVTGYQGAELNPFGNYWIVRQSDAHAWAEVWLNGRWIRYDPTAAVAPWRIERGYADGPAGAAAAGGPLGSVSLINRLALSWDAINAGWNRWVLSFGPDSQTTMMSLAGIENPSTEYLVVAMAVSVTVLLIVIGLWQRHHLRPRRDPVQAAYRQLCRRLERVARPRQPGEGPREYADVVQALRPDLGAEAGPLFDAYIAIRYDGRTQAGDTRAFIEAVRCFRPSLRPA